MKFWCELVIWSLFVSSLLWVSLPSHWIAYKCFCVKVNVWSIILTMHAKMILVILFLEANFWLIIVVTYLLYHIIICEYSVIAIPAYVLGRIKDWIVLLLLLFRYLYWQEVPIYWHCFYQRSYFSRYLSQC